MIHPWHLDTLGHMNARWLAHILDDAAFQFWARQALSQQQMRQTAGVLTVTASTQVDFLREIGAGDCYVVTGGPTRVGGKSVTLGWCQKNLRLKLAGRPIASPEPKPSPFKYFKTTPESSAWR